MDFIVEQISNLQNLALIAAVFLFYNARSLVRSVPIFYSSGTLVGVLASLLLLGFFIQRLIPKSVRLPFFFGGWPISAYIYYWTWRNIGTILRDYHFYAIIYLCFFTLLSLAVCYRIGPPQDVRSINLAEWTLQLIALTIIYFVVQNHKIGISIIVLLVLFSLWKQHSERIRRFWRRISNRTREFLFGPVPRRLLSEEEYLDESVVYTRMELDKLRQHCQTQDSRKNWRLMSRLHTPNKMASFITGDNDHVSPDEVTYHSELFDQGNEGDSEENSNSNNSDGFYTDDD